MNIKEMLNGRAETIETMQDYVRWRADLSFQASPFNAIDNMILCELSYVDYSKVLERGSKQGVALSVCGEKILNSHTYDLRNLYGGHEDFFASVCHSKRFGEVKLRNYVDIFAEEEQTQFSAVEFVLDAKTSYIAFRGTDNTLVGWKEDFMIAFTRIQSQVYAKDYLAKAIHAGHTYYVGGHSKGGNLALYACAWLNDSQLARIKRIYDNDGPGFCPEMFDMARLDRLKNMTTRIIPQYCVIGKIFEVTFPDTHIVLSTESGANQHDIISWRINAVELVETDQNDHVSEWLDQTIAEWVNGADLADRKTFVDEMFAALGAGGAETMQEVFGKGLPEVLKALTAVSPTSKKLVSQLAEIALQIK